MKNKSKLLSLNNLIENTKVLSFLIFLKLYNILTVNYYKLKTKTKCQIH